MAFRENLIYLRSKNNLTQEKLAMLLGVSRQSVTKWEADKSTPEMDKLLKMCQLFDCTLDELVQGDLTNREASPSLQASTNDRPQDVFGYDELMRRFANRISSGVAAPILGVALLVFFAALSDSADGGLGFLPENVCVGIGMMFLFIGVACCLWLIIPAGMDHSTFVKAHPYLEDFYTEEQKAHARKVFSYELVGGIALIFAGICTIIVLADTAFELLVGVPALLLLISLGVRFIVHGGITLGKTNIDQYNQTAGEEMEIADIERSALSEERKQALLEAHKNDKKAGAICGAIMIMATIIGLLLLFVPSVSTPLFWLAWPIGGLLCAIVSTLIKGFSS